MNMKNKTIGSWLQCAAGALALVTAIALIIYSGAVKDANSLVPTLLIIGAALSAAAFFTGLHPLAIFPGVLFMAAAATYLGSQLANISGLDSLVDDINNAEERRCYEYVVSLAPYHEDKDTNNYEND